MIPHGAIVPEIHLSLCSAVVVQGSLMVIKLYKRSRKAFYKISVITKLIKMGEISVFLAI